jgi:hypothetical protein
MPMLLGEPVDQVGLLAREVSGSLSEDCAVAVCNPLTLLRNARRGGCVRGHFCCNNQGGRWRIICLGKGGFGVFTEFGAD